MRQKRKSSSVDIPTGWDPRTKQQRRVALADFSAAPWRGFEKSERGPNSSSLFQPLAAVVAVALGWLLALPAAGPRCSNPSRSQSQRVTYAHAKKAAASTVDIPTGWDPRTKQQPTGLIAYPACGRAALFESL